MISGLLLSEVKDEDASISTALLGLYFVRDSFAETINENLTGKALQHVNGHHSDYSTENLRIVDIRENRRAHSVVVHKDGNPKNNDIGNLDIRERKP